MSDEAALTWDNIRPTRAVLLSTESSRYRRGWNDAWAAIASHLFAASAAENDFVTALALRNVAHAILADDHLTSPPDDAA